MQTTGEFGMRIGGGFVVRTPGGFAANTQQATHTNDRRQITLRVDPVIDRSFDSPTRAARSEGEGGISFFIQSIETYPSFF